MPASHHAILVASGADRPGVLDDISIFLAEREVQILESRVSLLRGQFALLLLVGANDEADLGKLDASLHELAGRIDVHMRLRPAGEVEAHHDITPMRLRASGPDPAVAVHRLSHLLRVLNTNIENIETTRKSLPDGKTRFELEMELSVPRHTPIVMLRQYVDALASEIGISCEVNPM